MKVENTTEKSQADLSLTGVAKKPVIGVSSCLLGNKVRFDTGHKHNRYITDVLGDYFDLNPFCPEMGAGMSSPRPPIRLVKFDDQIKALDTKTAKQDFTQALKDYGPRQAKQLVGLSGFILKKDSPSCGMERVKLYNGDKPTHPPERSTSGIFAQYLKTHFPLIPLEEEGRLLDPVLRENFIARVYIYYRWLTLLNDAGENFKTVDLVNFHSDHKYIITAHDQKQAVILGQMVSKAGKSNLQETCQQYIELLMQVLKKTVSRGRHANVLFHLLGYLKNELDGEDRNEVANTISKYQQGYIPLVVPITLLNHHFRKHPRTYIERQYYMKPHPEELMLRNGV